MSVAGTMKTVLSSTEDVAQIVDNPQMEYLPQLKGVMASSYFSLFFFSRQNINVLTYET